jgi:hypothetical protein
MTGDSPMHQILRVQDWDAGSEVKARRDQIVIRSNPNHIRIRIVSEENRIPELVFFFRNARINSINKDNSRHYEHQ